MPGPESQLDAANRRRGYGFGLAAALPLSLTTCSLSSRKVAPHFVAAVGALLFIAATCAISGWAAVRTGRRATGGGAQYGVAAALVSMAAFMALATACDLATGHKSLGELPATYFAGIFFGTIPAALVGALAGRLLSAMVQRSPAPPSGPT